MQQYKLEFKNTSKEPGNTSKELKNMQEYSQNPKNMNNYLKNIQEYKLEPKNTGKNPRKNMQENYPKAQNGNK